MSTGRDYLPQTLVYEKSTTAIRYVACFRNKVNLVNY
jgi:hypothetical protein